MHSGDASVKISCGATKSVLVWCDEICSGAQGWLAGAAALLHKLPGAASLSAVSRQHRLILFLVVNVSFMVVEFVHGYMNNSLGMLSDAAHMLLDNAAVVIGLAAEHHAGKCSRAGSRSDPARCAAC